MAFVERNRILVTGGSGLLGKELQKLLMGALFPTRAEFNITDPLQMDAYLIGKDVELILHAAAFTSPPKVDDDPVLGIDVNIIGTANLSKLCSRNKIKLVYISTDYVFNGEKGSYREDDPVHPVNKYAWSKLGGECAVRMHDPHLIVRTSFGPNDFPYPKAFVDQWTSRQSVREIAQKLVAAINAEMKGVLHLGGKRQTVFDYAKEVSPEKEIGEMSIHDVSFTPPVDTSLDPSKYERLVEADSKNQDEKVKS